MRHAEHHVVHAVGAAAIDQLVEQRDQAVAAFEREALLADVLRVQVAFESVGLGQLFEDAFLLADAEPEFAARAFQLLVDPAPLFGVGDMHELGADRARVVVFSSAMRSRSFSRCGPASEPVLNEVSRSALPRPWNAGSRSGACGRGSRPSASRSAAGKACSRSSGSSSAARCPRERYAVTSLSTPACLCASASLSGVAASAWRVAVEPLSLLDSLDDDRMRHIAGFAALQRIEIGAPFGADRGRIGKVPLVEIFDERSIAACDRRRRLKLLKKIRAHTLAPSRRKSAPGARRINRGIIAARGASCCIAASWICVLPA